MLDVKRNLDSMFIDDRTVQTCHICKEDPLLEYIWIYNTYLAEIFVVQQLLGNVFLMARGLIGGRDISREESYMLLASWK